MEEDRRWQDDERQKLEADTDGVYPRGRAGSGDEKRSLADRDWATASGLETSAYLLGTAKEHIEGKIDIKEAQRRIVSYYEVEAQRQAIEEGTAEADIVSSRIAELLGERTFQFSPVELQNIHRRLFQGVFDHAGVIRTYNISKKEWVLDGASVIYAPWDSISETLDYDFRQEKQFSYEHLSLNEAIRHLATFASGIWQIHPFGEGNTRATAVFIIKYMRTFGLNVDNEAFMNHSWYFRNALVRANYNDLQKGIHATPNFLMLFFENLLLGANHVLKNRTMHVDFDDGIEESESQSATEHAPKCQIGTLECTLEELAVLQLIAENPSVTQKAIQEKTGIPLRTVKRTMASLQDKGYLQRVNGKRYGYWMLLVEI